MQAHKVALFAHLTLHWQQQAALDMVSAQMYGMGAFANSKVDLELHVQVVQQALQATTQLEMQVNTDNVLAAIPHRMSIQMLGAES